MPGKSESPSIHASAVLAGAEAVLIRGEPGSGKSLLVLQLLQAAARGALPFARLIGDDRVRLEVQGARLLVRPANDLAGLLEIRGLGIRRLSYETVAVTGLVVDLAAQTDRFPEPAALETSLFGVRLPRLAIPPGTQTLPLLLAALGYPASAI